MMRDNKILKVLKQPIFILVILIISIKILSLVFRYHLTIWDEAVYLGMGKWIYSCGKIGIWESIRPIGLPLLLGIFWRLGLDYILSADIIMLVFSAGAVVMTYLIAEEIFNRKIATISAFLTFFTPIFFHNSNMIMTGIPSLFLTLVALYLIIKKKYLIAGLYSGAAFVFRYPSALVYFSINLIFLFQYIRSKGWKIDITKILKYNLAFLFVVTILFIYNKITYGSILEQLFLASQHQSVAVRNVGGLAQSLVYYPYTLIVTNVLLVFSFVHLFIRPKGKKIYYILIPLAVFFIYFTIIPHKQPRFALIFLPYVVMFAIVGFFNIARYLKDYKFLRVILIGTGVIMLSYPLIIDYKLFTMTPSVEPDIISDYYRYFEGFDKGAILTSDPVHAAYTDSKYIGYYNNISDAHIIFDKNIDEVSAVIYTPASFPCLDYKCNESKKLLEEKIINSGNLVYDEKWWDEPRQIYSKE